MQLYHASVRFCKMLWAAVVDPIITPTGQSNDFALSNIAAPVTLNDEGSSMSLALNMLGLRRPAADALWMDSNDSTGKP